MRYNRARTCQLVKDPSRPVDKGEKDRTEAGLRRCLLAKRCPACSHKSGETVGTQDVSRKGPGSASERSVQARNNMIVGNRQVNTPSKVERGRS